MTSLFDILAHSGVKYSERVAVRQGDHTLTYAQLFSATGEVVSWARENRIGVGDRVVVMLPNVSEFPVFYYGMLRAGAVVVPLNPLLKRREIQHVVTDSGAVGIVAWHECTDAFVVAEELGIATRSIEAAHDRIHGATSDEIIGRHDGETAVILYTSGTTGTPKGAELSHANVLTNTQTCATSLFGLTEDDVVLGSLPLFHTFGQTCAMNSAIYAGATITLLPRFTPADALDVMRRDRVTVFDGVPTMYVALTSAVAGENQDPPQLRLCVSGGAALPEEVLNGFEAAFGCEILEGYGLSETSPVASFNMAGNRKVGSIGVPIEDVEMRVVDDADNEVKVGDVGEIVIRGHNVMKGYWAKPDESAVALRGGWFHTGDMAKVDEDGFFFIVDRKKDMIIRGGYNIYPREIEEVLYKHPQVVEAAVIGVRDQTYGEEVAAAVVVRSGSGVTPEEIRVWVKERVAAYKYPRLVWLTTELPKGPTGKILKRAIQVPT